MSSLATTFRLRASYSPAECRARILALLTGCDEPIEFRAIRDVKCLPLASVEEVLAALDYLERDGQVYRRVEACKTRDGRQRMVTKYALAKGGAS